MTDELIVPTGHSLEVPDSNLAQKLHIKFHAGEHSYTFILTKDQYEQLVDDIIDYTQGGIDGAETHL
jgi:hypothetical protein